MKYCSQRFGCRTFWLNYVPLYSLRSAKIEIKEMQYCKTCPRMVKNGFDVQIIVHFSPFTDNYILKKNSDLCRCFSSLLNDVFAFQDDRRFSGFSYACHVIVYARWQFYAIIGTGMVNQFSIAVENPQF